MVPTLRAVGEHHHAGLEQAGIVEAARREKDEVGKIGEPQVGQMPREETLPLGRRVVMPCTRDAQRVRRQPKCEE